jgi:hypothetical protein
MTFTRPFLPAAAAAVALAAAAVLALVPGPSHAHAEHGKPQHGGVVAEAGTFQGELVAGPKGATLYITDHGAPVPTAGASAKLVVLSGAQKAERELVPAGDNRLAVAGGEPLAKGAKAVATVKLKDGRSGALRFDVK